MLNALIYVPFADFAVSHDAPMLPLGTTCAIVTWKENRVRPTSVLRRGGILVGTSTDKKVVHLCFKLEDGYVIEEVNISCVGVDCTDVKTRYAIADWVEGVIIAEDGNCGESPDEDAGIDNALMRKWADAVCVSWAQLLNTLYVRDLDAYNLKAFVIGISSLVHYMEDQCETST